ncbi:SWEET sugar transporter [Arabidopsis thaliana x Arabidopsis arenosa]|uniref:Bidirectional sugar transporter SWEET n=1 Tax=Arabidopsis thaliana x Arabidopsis arenosa TaxID=1240361 RepID=A0A8T1ZMG3_9BRAS|nr:SWEET sugar transporter [Arabidopsis thaliana x Arabidopsis arenosa]
MLSATVARNIAGIFGNLIPLFVFLSPIPSFITIYKNKKVEGYKADPYLATVLNCTLWVFYGLPIVHPGSILVIPINAVGLCLGLSYLAMFFYFSPTSQKVKLGLWFIGEIVFIGIVAACTLLLFHTHKQRSCFVGILCVISVSCLIYIAPLTIMIKVIKTKSVKYMPFSLSLAYFLNGVVWVAYALIKFDLFSLIGNGLGTVSGAVQLILYACYYKTTPKDDEKHSNVNSQLQVSGNQGGA